MKRVIKDLLEKDFKEIEGMEISICDYPYTPCDREYEYFCSKIDGFGVISGDYKYFENRENGEIRYIPKGELFGIQIKTTPEKGNSKWKDGIPKEYVLKCQWYMGITGFNYFLMIYLIGNELNWKVIQRNNEEIRAIKEEGRFFYDDNVIKKIPQKGRGRKNKALEGVLKKQFQGEVMIKDNKIKEIKHIENIMKGLKKKQERIKDDLMLDMGDSMRATDGEFMVKKSIVKRVSIDNKLLKEKYPEIYKDVVKGSNEYFNMKVSKVE